MKQQSSYIPPYSPIPARSERALAVAIQTEHAQGRDIQKIAATGRGKLAEQILAIAFEKGIKVREDADLAELLSTLDLDTPIPPEAIVVVAEILARVYQLNASMSSQPTSAPSTAQP